MFLWNPKSVTSSNALLHNGSYAYAYSFWILSTIKIKFGQILVCCMANISKMFLTQCWRLRTSSRPFDTPLVFQKISFKGRMKPWFFVTFNITISCIFLENFIEIPQVVQKSWKFFCQAIFIFHFWNFWHLLLAKKTNNVSS